MDRYLTIYCGHLSTPAVSIAYRLEQVDSLISHIVNCVDAEDLGLVGGDFNTTIDNHRNNIIEKFDEIEFEYAISGIGETHKSRLSFFRISARSYIY